MITLLVTDRNLTVVGDPIVGWTDLDIDLRLNEPSSGQFTCPATDAVLAQLEPGRRIVAIRDGDIFMAGPIESMGPYDWAAGGGDAAEPGQITVRWADDLALVAGRITYPTPSAAATAQTAAARYTDTDFAGTLMTELVNLNAGPGALAARQVDSLIIGSGAGVGPSVKVSTRFEALGDVLRSLAIAGGGLGFRVVQDDTDLVFEVYEPADLTGQVRFSRGLRNLRSVSYEPTAPSVTAAIVGGDGEGTARTTRERLNASAIALWWRLETFVDNRGSSDATELDQAGDEALAEGAETARLATVTVDTEDQRYGTHYGLGDLVSVEVRPGLELAEVVRAVRLTADPNTGETVTAVIGSQEASPDPEWVRELRAVIARVARLEAST